LYPAGAGWSQPAATDFALPEPLLDRLLFDVSGHDLGVLLGATASTEGQSLRQFLETLYAFSLRSIAMTEANPRPQLAHLTTVLDELRAKGTYFHLRVLDDQQAPVCHYDGKEVINLASNNYLGLANHPRLIQAAVDATRTYGVGSGAVRTIAGTMRLHIELEEKIARFKRVEACVVFQSGFAANAGTVSAILGKEDFILSDELNHASIIDGARLSRATIKVFRHKDADHCEQLLQELADQPGRKLIITDGVFSMDGDIGPVDKLAPLSEKYGAIMMVDDAHASGVLGRNGRGSVDHFAMEGKVDVQVGTLSKAIGSLGGYVCGSKDLIEYLYHRARPFLFSTSHPPSIAATCIAAFDILEDEPERILRLWENTRYFQSELKRIGFNIGGVNTPATETPITPIIVGEGRKAMEFSRALFDHGVMATGIAFPTVPEGKARIRLILTSEHTRAQLDQALDKLLRVAKQLGILQ
jgi:glycine C-acetyltransferase